MRVQNLKLKSLIAILIAVSSGPTLLAANSVSTQINNGSLQNSGSNFSGDFGFQANNLVEDVGEVVGNKHFGELNIKYDSLSADKTFKKVDLASRVNNEEILMYSLKEAFVEFRYSTSELALGRKVVDWSPADSTWGLGKINNRVNFDYFTPGQEGLVGAFYNKKYSTGFNLSMFGSFVYIPEQGHGMQIDSKNGTVSCKTPWCKAPGSSVNVEGKNVPIYYDVEYPEVSDVVLRYSTGIRAGYEYKRFSTDAFYMRKPENGISIAAEISVESDFSQIDVGVTPQFYYHDVTGMNLGYQLSDDIKIYGAAISSIPSKYPDGDQPYIEYTGIKPKKIKEDYLGGGIVYSIGVDKIQFDYIARVSDFDRENEVLAEYPRWNQALHLGYAKRLTRKVDVGLDYKFDMLTEDRLTMLNAKYRISSNVIGSVGVNIIGTNPNERSYWSDYDNNDAVYTSLKVVF